MRIPITEADGYALGIERSELQAEQQQVVFGQTGIVRPPLLDLRRIKVEHRFLQLLTAGRIQHFLLLISPDPLFAQRLYFLIDGGLRKESILQDLLFLLQTGNHGFPLPYFQFTFLHFFFQLPMFLPQQFYDDRIIFDGRLQSIDFLSSIS